MNSFLKWTLIALPVIAGGAVVYIMVKRYKVPAKTPAPLKSPAITNNNQGSTTTKPPTSTTVASTGCNFPIKKGSYNNTCVGPLQDALGVTVDNDFGKNTEAALLAKTGKTQISSAAELADVINTLNNVVVNNRVAILAKTNQLLAMFNANKQFKYIQILAPTSMKQVTHDPDNEEWNIAIPAYLMDVHAGLKLNLVDYTPVDPDNATGNFVIYCWNGGNVGYWMVSPDCITFV